MSEKFIGLVIGGVIPAVLLGIFGVLQKISNKAGIGLSLYLIIMGVSITLVGGCLFFLKPDRAMNLTSFVSTGVAGIVWAISAALIAWAITSFNADISKLVPLYNMNTLVAVLLGVFLLKESNGVNGFYLYSGALLTCIGGILVVKA